LNETDRKAFGENVNNLRSFIEKEIKEKELEISLKLKEEKLLSERLDVTLPGFTFDIGRKHILNKVIDEVKSIFVSMGFDVFSGPEIETDYYNFEALNIPEHHLQETCRTLFIWVISYF